ncbi:MAG: amino acid ABC transporter permease [Alphaproteobacteria bacterium]|nr:amino acid ABC transporter permease [Alphaproteobacteria bacterium]
MYADTVVQSKLVHKPGFLLILLGITFAGFFALDFTNSIFGHFLAPAIGDPATSGLYGRSVVSFVLALIFVVNIVLIGFLPLRLQILVVWFELGLCCLGFFLLFNLSLEFIESKIWFMISRGLFTTLYVSAIAIVIASAIAIVGAIAKLSTNGFAFGIATFYTSLFRGLPLLMQLYLIYLGLPQLGFVVDAVPAGIAALALCYGAYMTEIFRAGIESIPRGQWEASRALGFKFGLTMRRIILPQAIPIIIPPTGNQFIAMLKDSSLVSVIGVWELMFLARTLGTKTFQHMEMLITAAMIYWVLTIILEAIQSRIEAHYRKKSAR